MKNLRPHDIKVAKELPRKEIVFAVARTPGTGSTLR